MMEQIFYSVPNVVAGDIIITTTETEIWKIPLPQEIGAQALSFP